MKTADFAFELPAELIAQTPLAERSASRLLSVDGRTGDLNHLTFRDLPSLLNSDDLLVFNNTRVLPARLYAQKQTGGRVEILIERMLGDGGAVAHVRTSKSPKEGALLLITPDIESDVSDLTLRVTGRQGALFLLEPESGTLKEMMRRFGHMPLPPYIKRKGGPDPADRHDYQTVYAAHPGAVAAPTAGLHFTEELFGRLEERGIETAHVTLHVGLGTFQPMQAEDTRDHVMHAEWGRVSADVAAKVNDVRQCGGRIVAVGTTSVRLLESAAGKDGIVQPFEGETDIFITPGYRFRAVDRMITNFHLPKSTLFMLVCAFSGIDAMKQAYGEAVAQQYWFYSYGDACLLECRA